METDKDNKMERKTIRFMDSLIGVMALSNSTLIKASIVISGSMVASSTIFGVSYIIANR